MLGSVEFGYEPTIDHEKIITGLARKEDFPFVTYYCPHCNALNRSKQTGEQQISGPCSPAMTPLPTVDDAEVIPSAGTSSTVSGSNSPRAAVTETPES